jgi:hypothetical protein
MMRTAALFVFSFALGLVVTRILRPARERRAQRKLARWVRGGAAR